MQNGRSANGISQARMALFATLFLGLLLLAVFALPSISRATRDTDIAKPTKEKPKRPEFVPGEILVRYRSEKAAQRQPRAAMVQSAAGTAIEIQVDDFEGSNIVEGLRMARVAPPDTLQAIAALKSQPDVLYAEPNYILHKETLPNDPRFPEMYGLKNTGQSGGTPGADIDAEQAWSFTTGSRNVVVGIIDEGIDINHPDLNDNIWTNPGEIPGNGIDDDGNGFSDDVNGFDFFHNDSTVFDGAADPNNLTDAHGTHVAGTIGAVGNNGTGVVGVNWQVSLMSLKFLGPEGGSDYNAIRAISYARNMRDTWVSTGGAQGANVRVLSNSYGGSGFSQAFLDAIKAAGNSGILFVAAAGNNSSDNDLLPHYPSSYDAPNMVAVAATDRFDNLSSFSNFGANTVHIAAPGSAILSTTPNNTYSMFSGTSMATPHVSGGAALICAANPSVTVQELEALLIFNGDNDSFLSGKTLMERRLNVAKSLQALEENDVTPPGTVTSFRITSQSGRSLSLAWTASGDDGANGQASLYQVSFTDAETGATIPLKHVVPLASGSPQTLDIKIPYRHTIGTFTLREFDNAGNEGIPGSLPVSVTTLDGDPYATTLGVPAALSTGGTPLGLTFDDRYRENYALPFSFPFFGQSYISVAISTNGSLYFSPPPKRSNGDADDVPSSTAGLTKFKMIAGLWDDLNLSTSSRADADVYVVHPDANRIIFRWQGAPCNFQVSFCTGGTPVNFEIELQSNGNIQTRYGSGNTSLFPVVGISGGEPDAYVIPTHTSEAFARNLTNAQTVTFASRAASVDYSVSGHVADDGNNPLSNVTLNFELDFQGTISTRTASTDFNGNYSFSDIGCQNSVKVTPLKTGYLFSPPSLTVGSTGCISGSNTANFTATLAPPNTVQFSLPSYNIGEGGGNATISLTRSGATSNTLAVNYQTNDSSNSGCNVNNGLAKQGCDYFTTAGTLNFAAGETSKAFSIPIIDDSQFEGNETLNLSLSNPLGGTLGSQNTAVLTLIDNDTIKPGVRLFIAQLNGAQEIPANNSPATGVGTLLLSADETSALVNLSSTGLSSGQTAANIHGAAAFGQSAPVMFSLSNGAVTNQTINLTTDQVQQLKQGLFYFNVHTNNFPDGEIRGQILPDAIAGSVVGFNPGANNSIAAFAVQPDGKILVGGVFTTMGGGGTGNTARSHIARLNADGTLDMSFDPGANSNVWALVLQPDGKILVGGDFTKLGGGGTGTVARNRIGRLNSDGTVDTSFNPGANGEFVLALALQADGKILVGGNFTKLGGGGTGNTPRNWIGRLNADGSLDASFDPGANGSNHFGNQGVTTLVAQADGKILVGGDFTVLGGGGTGTTTRNRIGRLNSDGTLDTSFDPGAEYTVYEITVQPDGKILVVGNFWALGGGTGTIPRRGIGRLNADGTLDMSFNPGSDLGVSTLALQPDGKILVGGDFSTLGGGGLGTTTRNNIGRLNADGSLDASFNPGAGPYYVKALRLQPDGKILVGGNFTTLGGGGFGNTTRNFIGRLNFDGTVDYTPPAGAPIVSSLSPSSATAGGTGFTLSVNGTGFVSGSVIRLNGLDKTSGFVDSTHLSTNIETTEIALAGPLSVTVTNPNGGTSSPVNLSVNNPVPAISTISPTSKRAGDAAFVLTVNGTNFNSSSLVCVGGVVRPTTLINSTQLTAEIPATDVASAGNLSITVLNQTPGGGTSGSFNFSINGTPPPSAVDGFDPRSNADVLTAAMQPDGKILVGGNFTTLGEGGPGVTTRNRIARINADGTLDTSFDPGANASITALAVQADGKILVGGFFSKLGGGGSGNTARKFIGRLDVNGTFDTSFDPGANGAVFDFAVQPDGKIVVVGNFTTLGGGGSGTTPRKFIGRLNADGTLDASFDPGANGGTEHVVMQADGKFLVAGNFFMLGGGGSGTTPRNFIGRLNSDGSLDTTFDPGADSYVEALAVQADGKILVGGGFSTMGGGGYGSITRSRIARLNANGELDLSFDPGANVSVHALEVQPDGKILVGGDFTRLGGGGTGTNTRNKIGRLNADGTIDTTFDPGANAAVGSLAVQPDGKILVAGAFTTLGGGGSGTTPRDRIGRLHADGTLDQNLDAGANGNVYALAVQGDGKILIGGNFTTLGGGSTDAFARSRIGRLNADGTLDSSFDPGANDYVPALAVQPDGKILVGGSFNTLGGGGTGTTTRNYIGRLHPDGTLDANFDPGAAGTVFALAVQPDGKILVGGSFAALGGGGIGTTTRHNLGRLNADGTLDTSFAPGTDFAVRTIAVQPDGKILLGGDFSFITLPLAGGGTTTRYINYLARLNPDGTVDTSFDPGANATVQTLALQPDGKVVVGGFFTTLGGGDTGSTTRNRVGRLNADGTLDTSFDPGANFHVETLALQADGKILLGGRFTTLGGGGTGTNTLNYIGRLNNDGTLDASFDPGANGNVLALAVQADGKILAGGVFTTLGGGGTGTATRNHIGRLTNTAAALQSLSSSPDGTTLEWLRSQASPELARMTFELSSDGITFSSLGNGSRIPGGWQLNGLTLSSNQSFYVRARGFYSTGQQNGSGSFAESVRLIAKPPMLTPPSVSGLSPSSVMAGGAGFTLTVNGAGFVPGFAIRVNGLDRTTTFVDSTHLTTEIEPAEIATAGTLAVRVFDPNPNGGQSASLTLTINNPMPAISSLQPSSVTANGPNFTLTVNGTNFVEGSVIRFNTFDRVTNFVSPTQLTTNLTGLSARIYPINVVNPAPGGGLSNTVTLAANPLITTISPTTVRAGDIGFTLTVNGAGFAAGMVVRFNGVSRPTTYGGMTQLTASIPSSDIATVGTYPITVLTPPSTGSLTSNAVNITVVPSITNLTPLTAVAGAPGFTLTIDGCCFGVGTVVRWNGNDRQTTVVGSSRLTAQITAADIALGGVFPITIFIPGPGGGTTLTNNFVVSNPVPTIGFISPGWFVPPPFCGNALTLTVNGTNFVGSSVIKLNGIVLSTNLLSSTQLTAQITEADLQTGGPHFLITVQNPAPGGGISNSATLIMNEPWSTITSLEPASATAGSGPFTLIVNGDNFSCTAHVLFNGSNRPTTYIDETKLTAQLTAADVQAAGTFPISVFKPSPGGAVSNAVDFTVRPPIVDVFSISPNSTVAGGPGVTLTVIGNNFFDGIVVRWNGSDRPTTVISGTQLTAAITAADIQTPGQAAVTISLPGGFISPSLTFTITSTSGYEGDVSPRPNGNNNGTVSIADWVQAGRFVAGLDTPDPGSEFQRADCAPRDTLGNGSVSIADWVQAGRYAAGLDSVTAAGGPTAAIGPTATATMRLETESVGIHGTNGAGPAPAALTRVELLGTILPAGQGSTVSIEFDAQGNENAFGFSLMFDPAKLSFVSAAKSDEAGTATLNVNKLKAAKGRIGIALALPGGSTFAGGRHQLVVLTFVQRSDSSELPTISFADLPIAREVADLNANRLSAVFQGRSAGDPLADAQFFVNQHYLDFLRRTPDSEGLEYWTQQINECGTDKLCINQRRIGVSAAFFVEQEFQQTGSFVYRLYKAGLGRQLSYAEFAADRGQVIGGSNLIQSQSAFADAFVERSEFVRKHQQHQTAAAFIDHLLQQLRESSQVDLSLRRSELIALYQTGRNTNQSRSRVLQTVAEDASFKQAEYNSSFVLMEYFGYLGRDPDKGGYDFWLNVLNNRDPGNYRGMVCSFITATEYQRRFSQVVSHSNADCSQ